MDGLVPLKESGVGGGRAGDEYGATRGGNNNWYGHDTEMTWFDWDALKATRDGFTRFYRRSPPPPLPVSVAHAHARARVRRGQGPGAALRGRATAGGAATC